jgi:alkanesulfonate monooxygenase SsuD/methylene tetrahydromethanopterin reductase-like flavin-dependent oxidoreductase (luciferase family)
MSVDPFGFVSDLNTAVLAVVDRLRAAEEALERVRALIEMAPTPYEGPRVVRVDDLQNALDPEGPGPVADDGPQV